MAVSVIGVVDHLRTAADNPHTWVHDPTATPQGVLVGVIHPSTTDHVLSITYGGQPLTRVQRNLDSAGEAGAAEWWFLGVGVPIGTATVSVSLASATTEDIHFVSITLFSGIGPLCVIDRDGVNDNLANPGVTLQYGGRSALAFAAFYSGLSTIASLTPGAGCTALTSIEFPGNVSSLYFAQTTATTTDFTIGATATTDDVAFAAVAIGEIAFISPNAGALRFSQGPRPNTAALLLQGAAPVIQQLEKTELQPSAAGLTLGGTAAVLQLLEYRTPGPAVLALTGTRPAPLDSSQQVTRQPGAGDLRLARSFGPTPTGTALTLTGSAPQLSVGGVINFDCQPGAGRLRLTRSGEVAPATGELILTGQAIPSPTTAIIPTTGELWFGEFSEIRPRVGALTLQGAAPTVQLSAPVPGTGSLVLTGQPAFALSDTKKTPPVATLTMAGQAAAVGIGIQTPGAALVIIGEDEPNLAFTIPVPTATLSLTGAPPNVQLTTPPNQVRSPNAGALVLIGAAPTLLAVTNVNANPQGGVVTVSAAAPDARQDNRVSPGSGSLVLLGGAAEIQVPRVPPTGALTLQGSAPQVGSDHFITPAAGSLALAGTSSVLFVPTVRTPATVPLTAVGQPPSWTLELLGSVGALGLTGQPSVVDVSSVGNTNRIPSPPNPLFLIGTAPTIVISSTDQPILVASGELLIQGADLASIGASVVPQAGALIFTGHPSLDTAFRLVFVIEGRAFVSELVDGHAATPALVEALAGVAGVQDEQGEA